MGNWNLGSVATEIQTIVDNIPTTLSGNPIEKIADRQRTFIEQYSGQTVGSTGIDIKWQGPLLNLTISETLNLMNTIGADFSSIHLGDFSESKGGDSNIIVTAERYRQMGMEQLQNYGKDIRFYKALG